MEYHLIIECAMKLTISLPIGVRIRGNKCCPSSNSWQQPEIRTNLGEPLSLWDQIKPLRASSLDKREERAAQWQGAHCKGYVTRTSTLCQLDRILKDTIVTHY